ARILGACNVGAWISVSLYDAYGPKSAQFIVQDSGLQVVFCTLANFDGIVGIQKECPNLRFIVVFDKATTIASSKDNKSEFLKEAQTKPGFSASSKDKLLPRISIEKNADAGGNADVFFLSDIEEYGIRFGTSLTGEDKEDWVENVELDIPNEDDIFSIVYTSGTTAQPKGAMIKHGTFTIQLGAAYRNYLDLQPTDVHLSYLPLAHVLEWALQGLGLYVGIAIAFYRGNPRTLTADAAVVKPTFFVGTPRVYERVRQAILQKVSESPFYKRWIFNAAIDSRTKALRKMADESSKRMAAHTAENLIVYKPKEKSASASIDDKDPSTWPSFYLPRPKVPPNPQGLFDNSVLRGSTASLLGGQVRFILSIGAPLSPVLQEFLQVVFLCPALSGYGLTESCAGNVVAVPYFPIHNGYNSTLTLLNEMKLVSVPEMNYFAQPSEINKKEGKQIKSTSSSTLSVFKPTGEVLFRGPCIFTGYWNSPELTAETIDAEGWLHTGDIGEVDPTHNNYLRIIDRKKNIFKMSQGEYIQPESLEQTYGDNCPAVQQIFVYGSSSDSKLVAIVVPNEENIKKLVEKGDIKFNNKAEIEHKCAEIQAASSVHTSSAQPFISAIIECSAQQKALKVKSAKGSDPLDILIKYYLDEFNRILSEQKLPHFHRIFSLIIESEAWSVENGFLSPTLKLKRFMLRTNYEKDLERLLNALGSKSQ
ncbi:MAG: long-chain acyl-CoA synthetase, partial [Streblomastix strix]